MNLLKNNTNNITILRKYHVIFWVSYFTFNVVRWGSYFDDYWYSLKSNLIEFPLHILLVYANLYYFIPKFLILKKYKSYILSLIFSLAFLYIIRTGLNYFLVTKNIWPEAEGYQQAFTFNHIVAVILGELYVIALATAIKLTVDWTNQKDRLETLKKEHLKTELNFLKAQIQPHFFFNTLNNLYALTLEKSSVAPDVVLKLSDIMQYVIYDVKDSKVNLTKEINYIKNYIDLERLRYNENAKLNLNIIGDVSEIKIPSLIFLSFIENCFKHNGKINNFYVKIIFENLNNTSLLFTVENNYVDSNKNEKKPGIGNKNIKRRLDLLYQNKYYLDISNKQNIYKVKLEIPLN